MRIDPADKLIFVNIKQSYEAMLSKDTTHPLYRETIKECTRKYYQSQTIRQMLRHIFLVVIMGLSKR